MHAGKFSREKWRQEKIPQGDPELSAILEEAAAMDPEEVYARGYAAWQESNYDRALIDFSWLVMTQPWSWRSHLALAGVLLMKKEYAAALNFYGYTLMLDAAHPEPVYQMGVCLHAMGQIAEAREALQTAVTMSYADSVYSDVRINAESMLQQLLI